eukprot:TRINITY_DN1535_c1_g1_i1.p1 TRINITY_DN1535_c1_g1~~TRINITY_DN1535_c1_g1_i1.p1  ORF type:complete len:268 (+),score=36.07 TRINITY_DN1535_c1_g1_i1:82-885(+)
MIVMEDLDKDSFAQIFSYLNPLSLARSHSVCSRWNARLQASDVWTVHYERYDVVDEGQRRQKCTLYDIVDQNMRSGACFGFDLMNPPLLTLNDTTDVFGDVTTSSIDFVRIRYKAYTETGEGKVLYYDASEDVNIHTGELVGKSHPFKVANCDIDYDSDQQIVVRNHSSGHIFGMILYVDYANHRLILLETNHCISLLNLDNGTRIDIRSETHPFIFLNIWKNHLLLRRNDQIEFWDVSSQSMMWSIPDGCFSFFAICNIQDSSYVL